jgi:hypothetical protein
MKEETPKIGDSADQQQGRTIDVEVKDKQQN